MYFDSSQSQREDLLLFCFTADSPGTPTCVCKYLWRQGEEALFLPSWDSEPSWLHSLHFSTVILVWIMNLILEKKKYGTMWALFPKAGSQLLWPWGLWCLVFQFCICKLLLPLAEEFLISIYSRSALKVLLIWMFFFLSHLYISEF